ncbi:MAG: hypothetical protein IJC26_07775 [Clostridia bacterium]|nr:hypothetical protein [Clostridia bacterium]
MRPKGCCFYGNLFFCGASSQKTVDRGGLKNTSKSSIMQMVFHGEEIAFEGALIFTKKPEKF